MKPVAHDGERRLALFLEISASGAERHRVAAIWSMRLLRAPTRSVDDWRVKALIARTSAKNEALYERVFSRLHPEIERR